MKENTQVLWEKPAQNDQAYPDLIAPFNQILDEFPVICAKYEMLEKCRVTQIIYIAVLLLIS